MAEYVLVTGAARNIGRAIAARGVQAQGGADAWARQQALSVALTDDWDLTPFRWYMPLVEDHVGLQGEISLHRHLGTSNWTVTTGAANGQRFGVTDGRPWFDTPDKVGGPGVRFFAPTMEFLPTLAFHVPTADVVSYVDTVERGGGVYDRVFVTWGDPEAPTASLDQYLVYYEQPTGRLSLVECTVRDFGPFVTGAVYYDDFDDGEPSLPRYYAMHLVDLDGPRVHRVYLDEVAWR